MYPVFPHEPASIVVLDYIRIGKVLISECYFVGFRRRLTAQTRGFWVATLGLDVSFLKGWDMKLIRSLSTLVLLGSVSWMLGCSANEETAGPRGNGGGSGVAGGALMPDSHMGHENHGDDVDNGEAAPALEVPQADPPADEAPKADAPADEAPKADAPAEEPKEEAPAEDAPKEEEPKADAPTEDAPKSE